jgi:hypothetical protein
MGFGILKRVPVHKQKENGCAPMDDLTERFKVPQQITKAPNLLAAKELQQQTFLWPAGMLTNSLDYQKYQWEVQQAMNKQHEIVKFNEFYGITSNTITLK